jgi:hypothetical protein
MLGYAIGGSWCAKGGAPSGKRPLQSLPNRLGDYRRRAAKRCLPSPGVPHPSLLVSRRTVTLHARFRHRPPDVAADHLRETCLVPQNLCANRRQVLRQCFPSSDIVDDSRNTRSFRGTCAQLRALGVRSKSPACIPVITTARSRAP